MNLPKKGYLRVTEILTPFTGIEFVPDHILRPAADRGTMVHEQIENFFQGFDFPEEKWMTGYMDSFRKFSPVVLDLMNRGKLTQETRLYCDEKVISGKFDCLIEVDDKTYIFDWKTSSQVNHKSWPLQGAAYKYLAAKNGFKNVQDVVFVKLLKTGTKATTWSWEKYDEMLERFFKCLELYRYFEMYKGRKYADE